MKMQKWSPLLSLALVCASFAPLPAKQPVALTAEPNWLTVVGLYPQQGTVTAQEELAVLLWLQNTRTAQDVARAKGESTPSLGCFANDIHLGYGAANGGISLADFPRTVAVLEQAREDAAPVLESLKQTFLRPRPFVSYPAVVPALPRPAEFSYPSSHAALGVLYCQILCQLDPADQAGFAATGNLIGTDRVLGGVHYPSDVEAGQRFGKAFATYWLDQPDHLKLIQTACAEWHRN